MLKSLRLRSAALCAFLIAAWVQAQTYDVVVYGGTSAGVVAAVQAARSGCSVMLLEPGQHLGAMSSEGLGGSDIDNHREFRNSSAVGGMALEFYHRVRAHYGTDAVRWRFEPHVAEAVFRTWVNEAGVTVRYRSRLREPLPASIDWSPGAGRSIAALQLEDGAKIAGRRFIDATFEGDLIAAAGIATIIGREANAVYGETKNGIRDVNDYKQFAVRVDPWKRPGDPSSGLIATIQDEALGEPGSGDHRIQGYCFRLCFTRDPANRLPWVKPEGYDPATYEIYRRYLAAGGQLWRPRATLPNGKTDMGSWHDLSANLYGMNHEYPGGNYATRARILDEHLRFTQGLCWFLANDPAVPEALRAEWSEWGPCRDEFQDNGGWPRMFYVRDARRMISDYVITEHDTTGSKVADDPVAVAYWPPDTHHVRRIVRDGAAYNEGFVFGGEDWQPFGLSYGALTPRASECTNLLTPTCPSSSHVGYGALRLEWTFMALGQACALAADESLERNTTVQTVPYAILRERLLEAGAVLKVPARTSPRLGRHLDASPASVND